MTVVQYAAVGSAAADAGVGSVAAAAIVVYPVAEHALQLVLAHPRPRAPHHLPMRIHTHTRFYRGLLCISPTRSTPPIP